MGRREELGLRTLRGLVKHPRLGNAVFRFDRWGNIFGRDRYVDPYPIYERMRAAGPVSFSPILQQWAVVGYEEARQVLGSASFGVAAQLDLLLEARPYRDLSERTKALLRNALLFTDPPLHTRLRAAISRAFTPRQMARLEPRIGSLVDRLLAAIADDPAPDLVPALTEPLPIQVIGELLGVPEERWPWLTQTSAVLRTVLDTFTVVDPAVVDATADELFASYGQLVAERRAAPRDDLLSALAQADDLDEVELVSLVAILLLAGHETTTGALGNAIVALGRHPDQRAVVARDASRWPGAVEELLRYDTPVQTDPRAAFEDVVVGGKRIKKGQNLTVMMGAVNRDPRRFEAPDELRLDREDPSPLSFGHGIHHCIGAALVRAELRVALPKVLSALGDHQLDEERLEWKRSIAFRGPTRLVVRRG
jgi:cytochrome P450